MNKKQKILIILTTAAFIQLIIISYNHFKDIYPIGSILEFAVRLTYGTLLSALLLAVLYLTNMTLINYLNKGFQWNKSPVLRIIVELSASIIFSIAGAFLITSVSNLFFPYDEGLMHNVINNSLILSVCNLLFLTVLEAYKYFMEWNKLKYESERLEKENAIAKYNVLKSQINPHFLFNSLSVLSNIIEIAPEEADDFIEKLSHIYRYITDKIDRPVVTLKEELDFSASYLELQKVRHKGKISTGIDINNDLLEKFMVPMSMQIVLENCFKHNVVSNEYKLEIKIYNEDQQVIIENNYNPKNTGKPTGIGIQNLKGRYELVSEKKPEFFIRDSSYIAKLPLIEEE